jgi:hypothetical protein
VFCQKVHRSGRKDGKDIVAADELGGGVFEDAGEVHFGAGGLGRHHIAGARKHR